MCVTFSVFWLRHWIGDISLDSSPKGGGFQPHRRHCVVSLSKNINPSLVLVQPRKTRLFITERLLMGRKKSNQIKNSLSRQNKAWHFMWNVCLHCVYEYRVSTFWCTNKCKFGATSFLYSCMLEFKNLVTESAEHFYKYLHIFLKLCRNRLVYHCSV